MPAAYEGQSPGSKSLPAQADSGMQLPIIPCSGCSKSKHGSAKTEKTITRDILTNIICKDVTVTGPYAEC